MNNNIKINKSTCNTQPLEMNLDEIERKASELLDLYELNQVPVNLYELCNRLNISVSNTKFKEYENDYIVGAIKKDDDGNVKIYINKDDSINRNRFTIAHELGHYCLEHISNNGQRMTLARRDGYNTNNYIEKQANQFAAALLMNKDKVRKEYEEMKNLKVSSSTIINILSRMFGVSEQAMKFRLKNLELN